MIDVLYDLADSKYFGILKDVSIAIDEKFIDTLLKKNLFEQQKDSNSYEDSQEFDAYLTLNGKLYRLKDEIYRDFYEHFKYRIEEIDFDNVSSEKFSIIAELESILESQEKIKLLNSKHKKLFKNHKNDTTFMTYIGLPHDNIDDYGGWYEEFVYIISYESEFILKFLKGEESNISHLKMYEHWGKYYKVKELSKFYKEQISILKPTKLSIPKTTVLPEYKIFKPEGFALFNFINNSYQFEKNPAFYSYLYFYLKEKKLLNLNRNRDCKPYRIYIEKIELIEFITLQAMTSKIQYAKDDMFNTFDDYLKQFNIENE